MQGSLVLLSAALLAVSACGGSSGENDKTAPSEVTGMILFIETNVGFELSRLNAHVAEGDPVRCTLEERNGRLYALSIEDVPLPAE